MGFPIWATDPSSLLITEGEYEALPAEICKSIEASILKGTAIGSRRYLRRMFAMGSQPTRETLIPGLPAAPSRDANAVAAAPGSSASVIARTTTTRVAPAASTSSSRSRLIPPIANHGRSTPSDATWDSSDSPVDGRPGLVGVVHTGPAQK